MEKIVNTIVDCRGNEIPSAILFQEGGLLHLWEINCFSALHHGLGNCLCVNHPPSIEAPVSTSEVIQSFGEEALEGFDTQNETQIVFNAFGVEIDELETFIRISYMLGINPLPAMREKANVVFSENPDLLHFPEEEPGTIVFIVNSNGEIAVKIVD